MPLTFSSPIPMAHKAWETYLLPGSIAVDATCGNGIDTLKLAQLTGAEGMVFALDIQKEALLNTENLLKKHLLKEHLKKILLYQTSHESFPHEICQKKIDLVVYNLGYLPKGDKKIVTETSTTIKSIESALSFSKALSITCYPHEEGQKEEEALLNFFTQLDKNIWLINHTRWINREHAPSLFLIQKRN